MKRILLVDDSAFMRKVLKEMITGEEFEVVGECSSGLEAIEKFASINADLILMDYNMPGMDGLETARNILECDPRAMILMITSIDSKEKMVEAVNVGITDYVVKPFTRDEILAKLKSAIQKGSS